MRVQVRRTLKQSADRVHRPRELDQLISRQRDTWQIPSSVGTTTVIRELCDAGVLREVRLAFPGRGQTRYTVPRTTAYDIALSLHRECYLTHHTALYLHGLVEIEPRDVYVNLEQSNRSDPNAELVQTAIDAAFRRSPRITNNVATLESRRLVYLNGRQTGGLGVISKKGANGTTLRLTNVERTLIDAVVRPAYSGGISTVLSAFRRATRRMSTARLKEMLDEMQFAYPYHQSIGFLLEKSGTYSERAIVPFRSMAKEVDFYLDYRMRKPCYSAEWRLHYPAELDSQ